jgi:hypothetical protein
MTTSPLSSSPVNDSTPNAQPSKPGRYALHIYGLIMGLVGIVMLVSFGIAYNRVANSEEYRELGVPFKPVPLDYLPAEK